MQIVIPDEKMIDLAQAWISVDSALASIHERCIKDKALYECSVLRKQTSSLDKQWVESARCLASIVPVRSGFFLHNGHMIIWRLVSRDTVSLIIKKTRRQWRRGDTSIPILDSFKIAKEIADEYRRKRKPIRHPEDD